MLLQLTGPAASAKNLGCTYTIIGHSEERKDKLDIIFKYDPDSMNDANRREKAEKTVDSLMNEEALSALNVGMKVLLCVGESADERGDGSFEEQKPRIKAVPQIPT